MTTAATSADPTTPAAPSSTPSTPAPGREMSALSGATRWRRHIGRALALVCVAACAVWAFMPLGPTQVEVPQVSDSAAATPPPAPQALDLAAFQVPLWVAPAPAPQAVVEAPPPPPPPLKWQLLAIVREDIGYKALVYDPESDRLLVLKEGDAPGPQRVERVTARTMDVREGVGVRTLALREASPGGRP